MWTSSESCQAANKTGWFRPNKKRRFGAANFRLQVSCAEELTLRGWDGGAAEPTNSKLEREIVGNYGTKWYKNKMYQVSKGSWSDSPSQGRCSEKDIIREGQQYGPLDAGLEVKRFRQLVLCHIQLGEATFK